MNTQKYFKDLEKEVKKVYAVAEGARKVGLDPESKVETNVARSLAERVIGLISVKYPQLGEGIVKRIKELEKKYGLLDAAVAFKIAEEIAKQKFCKFASLLESIDAGLRVAFGYLTVGVVAAPLEGYTHFELKKTKEGKDYFSVYFSGPIGGAGRTIASTFLVIADYLRQVFGYAEYDPTEEEVKRAVTEVYDRHERVTNLQYLPTEEELEFLIRRLPIQLNGDPTEKVEVSNYKNLERIETNRIRSGFCLILAEGISQKAPKVVPTLNKLKEKGFDFSRWDFLEEFVNLQKKLHEEKKEKEASATYISDIVAGRPVLGHPSRNGGFRLRYGKCRTAGLSSMAMHPLTMEVLNNYVGVGTQLKYEGPGKSSAMSLCDDIEGPIVKLFNGGVVKIDSWGKAEKYKKDIEEVLFLGDFLVNYGEYFNRGKPMQKPGYVEEWYSVELEKLIKGKEIKGKVKELVENIIRNWRTEVLFDDAINLSEVFGIALHPKYIFYWDQINHEQFLGLIDWLKHARVSGKIIFPYNKTDQEKFESGKRALELLGIEHEVMIENVILTKENSLALFANLGIDLKVLENEDLLKDFINEKRYSLGETVLDIVNSVSKFRIRDKSGSWIGARMGRPEKAKLRKLTGSPNVLFPVGQEGGRLRSVQAALEEGKVRSQFPIFYCEKCKKDSIYGLCESCGGKTKKQFYFYKSKEKSFSKVNETSEREGVPYCTQNLEINYYFNNAVKKLLMTKEEMPVLIKGVRGTSSEEHTTEHLCKGLLRAKYNLQVNKDGTIRYDLTEMPLTHFRPKEIRTSIEELISLGYTHDKDGKPLEDADQLLELMPQDVILPSCVESGDEKADDVFYNIANYVDELLNRFYGLEVFYNLKTKEDLVGELILGLAPHTSAGIVGRIIGFSKTQGGLAHPMWHAAQRRDCEGDETCIMLLLDVFMNFSRKFLPSHRGATQDAPLVVTTILEPAEIDDMAFDIDVLWRYPLELYEAAEQGKFAWEIKIEQLKHRLGTEKAFYDFGFTHDVDNLNKAVRCSAYKLLPTMREKVNGQMLIAEKLRSVETSDVARLVVDKHFVKDLKGNLRNFSIQSFRCVACNEIVRRPPLNGICPVCRGKLIFTVHEGGIKKYLEPALDLASKYNLSLYLKQNLELVKSYIDSIFGKELEKQTGLGEFF